jgi:hypothetical protein
MPVVAFKAVTEEGLHFFEKTNAILLSLFYLLPLSVLLVLYLSFILFVVRNFLYLIENKLDLYKI